jgi:hypothetical protein
MKPKDSRSILTSAWRSISALLVLLFVLLPIGTQAQETPAAASSPDVTILTTERTAAGLQTTMRINVRKDAFLSSRQPDTNFGGSSELRLGWSSSVYEAMRILIEFDIGAIPRNAVVNRADLYIFQIGVTPGGDQPMNYRAQYMRSSWDEGQVTWNNANYLGGDELPLTSVDSSIGWKAVEVTALVKTWHSGGRSNHGLIVTGDETPANNRMHEFSSRERGGEEPYIILEFTEVCDTTPPSVTVSPLPAFSPGTFLVEWNGTDSAPNDCAASGIATYDVEYRINGGGWHRWKDQTESLSNHFKGWAANGDFVEFRARATDHAGNVQEFGSSQVTTRIDTQPPSVFVQPLPPTTPDQFFTISWNGSDNLSGVKHYDVQWRENGGPWMMLLEETAQTAFQMTGAQSGVTYDFRVRATDQVDNAAGWPSTPQASTTVAANPVAVVHPFQPPLLKPNAPITTSFLVQWSGTTRARSAMSAYEIYYRHNTGDWELWQRFPGSQLSAEFPLAQLGLGDGVYRFEAVAINNSGQREPQHFRAEASILVDLADEIQPLLHLPVLNANFGHAMAAAQSTSDEATK